MDLETGARSCADMMLSSRSWNGAASIDIVVVVWGMETRGVDGGGATSPPTPPSNQTHALSPINDAFASFDWNAKYGSFI